MAAAPSEPDSAESDSESSSSTSEDSDPKRQRRTETPTINHMKRKAGPAEEQYRKRFKATVQQLGGVRFFALRQEAEVKQARKIESEDNREVVSEARENAEMSFEFTQRRETDRVLRHMLQSVQADLIDLLKVKKLIERERGSVLTQFQEEG
jgi:hypothetical protein